MEEVRTPSCGALQQHGYAVLAARDGLRLFLWQASIEIRSICRSLMLWMPRPGGPDLCRKLRDCHLEVESLRITNERIGEQMMRGITLTALGNSDA
jgi:DNA-binding response OmpR family regulator